MNMIKKISCLVLFVHCCFFAQAQDFITTVSINAQKAQTIDNKVFDNLKTAIVEFMNTRDWIEDNFEPEERIELNIVLNIEEASQTDFRAKMIIQASRPVYNSGYNSVLFQNNDNQFSFSYAEFERLDFSENTFTSNLTSTLAFYAYVILGMDYDSFSEMGGTQYLQKAQNILNAVPENVDPQGWNSSTVTANRSRFWIIENLLNARMQNMRRAMYQYYMLGLDRIAQEDQTSKGLDAVLKALEVIQEANQSNPGTVWVQIFMDAKKDELLNLFQVADPNTRRKVYGILVKLDGSHANEYRVLLK